jgi:hypothetical protein
MRKLNKQIVSLILVLPILVMLAHDIIPHHHHDTHTSANFVEGGHSHHEAIHTSHCHSHETAQHLSHSHRETESICCSFVNLRFFKNFKFQVFLSHIVLNIVSNNDQEIPIRYYVSSSNLIPEPYRESTGLRGPPRV